MALYQLISGIKCYGFGHFLDLKRNVPLLAYQVR